MPVALFSLVHKTYFEKPTCKWAWIITFKHLWHSRILSSSFKYMYVNLERSYEAFVGKDLMRTILFESNQHLKLYVILCVLHILIMFMIYQSLHHFPNKWKPWPTTFCDFLLYICDLNYISSFIFYVYFDL